MRFEIRHALIYRYSEPVLLTPHWVRLRSRQDVTQRLEQWELAISPQPQKRTDCIDLDGNTTNYLTFGVATEKLFVTATTVVETLRTNPFDFVLEPWSTQLPLDYPISLRSQLQPYLAPDSPGASADPEAMRLGQELAIASHNNTVDFLTQLNQTLYQECRYEMRAKGAPWPPGITWRKRSGSCRDMAVLFMAVCRSVGLAARFVSGYQAGDPDMENRQLHAWAEVYLPGAGWRGYDPTQGLAVADGHVALVASANPAATAPVSGSFRALQPGRVVTSSEMSYDLKIRCS